MEEPKNNEPQSSEEKPLPAYFYRDGDALHARLAGVEMRLDFGSDEQTTLSGEGFRLELDREGFEVLGGEIEPSSGPFDTAWLRRMHVVWESIFNAPAPNAVRVW